MPMRDWIDKYPGVAALLEDKTDVLEGVSTEDEPHAQLARLVMEASARGPSIPPNEFRRVYLGLQEVPVPCVEEMPPASTAHCLAEGLVAWWRGF